MPGSVESNVDNVEHRGAAESSESSTKPGSIPELSRVEKQIWRLPARDRDMMEFSPRGYVTDVQYEDEKGLGGCRIQ